MEGQAGGMSLQERSRVDAFLVLRRESDEGGRVINLRKFGMTYSYLFMFAF